MSVFDDISGRITKPRIVAKGNSGQRPMPGTTVLATSGVDEGASEGCITASAKRARLLALLEELVAEGRRVLVFSQFVEMLKLIERDIAARGWGYHAVRADRARRQADERGHRAGGEDDPPTA